MEGTDADSAPNPEETKPSEAAPSTEPGPAAAAAPPSEGAPPPPTEPASSDPPPPRPSDAPDASEPPPPVSTDMPRTSEAPDDAEPRLSELPRLSEFSDEPGSARPSMEPPRESQAALAATEEEHRHSSSSRRMSPSRQTMKEKELAEAAEHRKLWTMAATSVANLIKDFSDKPIPKLDVIKQSFQPTTPGEWIKRREAVDNVEEEEEEEETVADDADNNTDLDVPVELFYDVDATDDDLRVFLGPSDTDIAAATIARLSEPKGGRGSLGMTRKPAAPVKHTFSEARKSMVSMQQISLHSDVMADVAGDDGSSEGGSEENEEEEEGDEDDEGKPKDEQALRAMDDDNDDWDIDDDQAPAAANDADEDPMMVFRVSDVDYDINEISKGLELLLEGLQLESRITERFKYKLVNKFNLLLHALVSTHDREYEILQHLQTKRKILNVLNNFVKAEIQSAKEKEQQAKDDSDDSMEGSLFQLLKDDEDEIVPAAEDGPPIEEMNTAMIRETLLKQKNRLDVLDAIKNIHLLKLKQREFEKTLLTLHYSKMIKPEEVEHEIQEATRLVEGLLGEISSLRQEMDEVQMDVKLMEKTVHAEEKVLEKLELEALTKQGEVTILQAKPVFIQKEADREASKLEQLQDMFQNLCQKQLDEMDNYRHNQGKIGKLNSEIGGLVRDEAKLTTQKKNSVKEIEKLMTQMEALITREQIMLDKAAQLTEKIQQSNKTKKKIHDEQQRIFNEANKSLRQAQRLERSIKLASEAFHNARLAYDKMRSAFDSAKPNEEDLNWQKLSRMLEKEIYNLKSSLERRLEDSSIKGSTVERLKAKLNKLYEEQVVSGKELQDLIKAAVRKRREREEKSEQCIKLDTQIQKFDQDIRMRELIIEDCKKSSRDLAKRIETVQGRINIIKLEKSAVVNDININREKLVEAKTGLRVMEGEVKVVGQRLLDLAKDLKDKHYLILNSRLARDSVRSEALRSRDKFRYHRKQKDDLLLENKTLRKDLERQKIEIRKIRKDFETAMNESNNVAMHVRERIEEICTFSEYIHSYDKILMKGASEITVREMEKTKLIDLQDELRKHVLIVKTNQPDETEFFRKIENLRQEFYETTEKRRGLELKLNDDNNPERVREIKFDLMKTRENVPALEKRLDQIEELLAFRDAIGLERTLIENHVRKISDDALCRALQLKDDYGEHVKVKTTMRKNLNDLSKQIDGFICENAIASAQAETAETMFLKFQSEIAEAEENLANGLPPTQDIENEWNHLQWRKEMMRRAYKRKESGPFYRKVVHQPAHQMNAAKLKKGLTPRNLEKPEDSPLGWRFSAESKKILGSQPLTFLNSAVNPRQSSMLRRRSSCSASMKPAPVPMVPSPSPPNQRSSNK